MGIYVYLSMRKHASRTVSSCFETLRQIRSIRWSVARTVLQSLAAALTLTRLDYSTMAVLRWPVFHATAESTSVGSQCSCSTSLLRPENWECVSTSRWSPLVSSSVSLSSSIQLPEWYSPAPPYHADDGLQPTLVHVVGCVQCQRQYCKAKCNVFHV